VSDLGPLDEALAARLCDALRAGEPVVVPTDTVYGVAALPSVAGATSRLYALKDRRPDVPLAVLVGDPADLDGLAADPDDAVRALTEAHWPGPLTLVVRRRADLAGWDLGGDPATIGVRCPAHPLVRAVARRVGPLATTSANRHGEPTPVTADAAAASLTAPVAVLADGGTLDGRASTVLDVTERPWRVLREGELTAEVLGLA
jgi:tRNA threonylcarbamoyl adenosine modification protein (Sua5/YciO/YrdC/YwlC family)